jgi:hypothetical protein
MVWAVISRAGNNLLPTQDPSFQAAESVQQVAAVEPPPPSSVPPQPISKPIVIKSVRPLAPPVKIVAPTEPPPSTAPPPAPAPSDTEQSDPDLDGDGDGDGHGDGDEDDGGTDGEGDDNGGAPVVTRKSWQGASGGLVAECEAWKITLVGARANSGYDIEVETGGPRFIRVGFVDQVSQEATIVTGNCRNGAPIFYQRVDSGGGSGETTD